MHIDNGIIEFNNQKINLYGSLGFVPDWTKWNLKLGVTIFNRGVEKNSRFKLSDKAFIFYHKVLLKRNHFRFGFIGALDFTKREISKKDILLGYHNNGFDTNLKLSSELSTTLFNFTDIKRWCSNYALTTTYQRTNRDKYGLEISHDIFSMR